MHVATRYLCSVYVSDGADVADTASLIHRHNT